MKKGKKSIIHDANVFKERLKGKLDELGLKHRDVEDITGIKSAAVGSYTRGDSSLPPLVKAATIAAALEVSLDYLCGLENYSDTVQKVNDNISFDSILDNKPARLYLMMHAGAAFCDVNQHNGNGARLNRLLDDNVEVRVLINSPKALQLVLPHMSGRNARYPESEKTIIAWWDRVNEYQNLKVRICEIPFLHRMYCAEVGNKNIVVCRYYTFANDRNLINPGLRFDSERDAEQCNLYRNEFTYMWNHAVPLDEDLVLACENALQEKRALRFDRD